jgi:tRNA A37 threonylcarbamoyladenosine dehydratase
MQPELDVCLDCLDGAKEKTALLVACTERKLPVVTCGGAAGKLDPTKIVAKDLTRVSDDRMLALVRKNLRQEHGFGKGLPIEDTKRNDVKMPRKWRITAVFSTEVLKPRPATDAVDASTLRRCDGALGTACFVTGTFGFVAAGQVVSMLARGKQSRPRKR